ncbi:MAG: EamA family transporter [Chloroflexi bacterium]|nr:EamA family transporter [Chloroflexota bacterium]
MFAIALVFICVVMGAFGQIFMKMGMEKIGPIGSISRLLQREFLLHIFTTAPVMLGLALYAVSAFLWLAALSSLNVSFAYPLLSLAYVLVAVISYFMLKEPITAIRWIGIIMTVVGSFLITRSN